MALTKRLFITILGSIIMGVFIVIFLQFGIFYADLNILPSDYVYVRINPNEYRFTITSVVNALQDFDMYFDNYNSFVSLFTTAFMNGLYELPRLIEQMAKDFISITDGTGDILSYLTSIGQYLGTFFTSIGAFIMAGIGFVGYLPATLLGFIAFFFAIVSGMYNIPVSDLPQYTIPNWQEVWDFTFHVNRLLLS